MTNSRPPMSSTTGSAVRVGDPDVADDLIQDTLVAALQQPPSLIHSPRSWLSTVLRTRCRSVGDGNPVQESARPSWARASLFCGRRPGYLIFSRSTFDTERIVPEPFSTKATASKVTPETAFAIAGWNT